MVVAKPVMKGVIMRTLIEQKDTEQIELFTLDKETTLRLEQYRADTGLDTDTIMKMAIDAIYRSLREDTGC